MRTRTKWLVAIILLLLAAVGAQVGYLLAEPSALQTVTLPNGTKISLKEVAYGREIRKGPYQRLYSMVAKTPLRQRISAGSST